MKNAIRWMFVLVLFGLTLHCDDDDPIQYQLTTEVSPEGAGTITPNSALYNEGSEVQIQATANDEYVFKNWTGDASGNLNPMKVVMTDDMVVTAVFEKVQYALNIEIVGEGTVTQEVLAAKGSTDYPSETTVELTAVPEAEWKFLGWSGDHESSENPIKVEMKEAMTLTATFVKLEFSLDVEIEGKGRVRQQVVQAKITDYDSGTMVQLTAEPAEEWQFAEWSGDLDGSQNPVTVTMEQDMNITAKFLPVNLAKTYIPDDNFEQALINKGFDEEMDDYVYTQIIMSIENINLEDTGIEDLTGIEDFIALEHLEIPDNNISSLDISQNSKLVYLNCNNNELTNLDISFNTALTTMHAMGNPLVCVQINEEQFEYVNPIPWIGPIGYFAEEGVVFSLDCDALSNKTTYVPDDNFEQALIDMGHDDVLDNYVKTIEIAGIRILDISNKNVSDLTGIQDFGMLLAFIGHHNNLNDIQLMKDLHVRFNIDISFNDFKELDISEFDCLYFIDVRGNELTCLQVSEEQLSCIDSGTQMTVKKDETTSISLDCSN